MVCYACNFDFDNFVIFVFLEHENNYKQEREAD